MIARSLETRIVKLEASRRRPNELLVVWRRPGGDVKAAASEAKYAPGDRVIVLTWFRDGPLPAPRWHSKSLRFSGIEDECLEMLMNLWRDSCEEGAPREPGFAELPHFPADRIRELSNNDLLHALFGVAT